MPGPDAPLRLENCACPLCGEAPPADARAAFPPYRVVDCPRCALRYLSPRVAREDLPRLYEGRYWEGGGTDGGYASYAEMEALLARTFARRLRWLGPPVRGARLLDVGCGPGAGLDAAGAAGWEPWGLDLSADAVAVASSRHPGRVVQGTLEDSPFPGGFFDAITAFDLVEHVYEPRRFAEALAAVLKPRGSLLIATPNVQSLLARATGRRWVSYKIPEHVTFYSKRTLADALAPPFRLARAAPCGQHVSLPFLLERVGAALPKGGGILRGAARARALSGLTLYANSGSMLVHAVRAD
ncbi:MAG TPA: class I SAM-dependent methyltransferase [Thermoanaerobaculia bacterium]|nr:class I SAM-dependent methyltransferase [Thermoanaerobaculia bacterium]